MSANGKEFRLNFAKPLECDTSSIAFCFNAAMGESDARSPRTPKALRANAFVDPYEFV
jgi:hypothetical protein